MNLKNVLITLSAVLGLAASAGAEDRAPQLPPVDAGAIWNQINNNHNPFPQPNQSTLDYCVFTEFKNNKCLFKCQSGAVLTEPAVKPDFSTGEPAGACATHIIRPIPSHFGKAAPSARRFEDYEGCSAVDNMFIMQPLMKDALAMLAPCMKSLGLAHGVPLKAAEYKASTIVITVGESDKAFDLVNEALAKRNGQFFGYPVTVKRENCVDPGPGATIEQVQAWIQCVPLQPLP